MAIQSDSELLEMFQTLGEQVSFFNGEIDWDVYGVLERLYVEVGEIESQHPVLTCRTIDTISHATMVVVHGTGVLATSGTYKVVTIQPDGDGVVALVLEKQ